MSRIQDHSSERTVWDLYEEKAKSRDEELMAEWTATLSSLPVFASIFAAVLTSFCIETRKMLEADPLESMQNTLLYIAISTNNASATFNQPQPFVPPAWSIIVNVAFFVSLIASILAAIGAVTCLQWVQRYDDDLYAASTTEQRTQRRHYRFLAAKRWYMPQIIATLPALLYISVALFFAGLAVWFWHVHRMLVVIPVAGLLTWVLGVTLTTFVTALFPSAPFKTPMSDVLFRILWFTRFWTWYSIQSIRVIRVPLTQFVVKLVANFFKRVHQFFTGNSLEQRVGKRDSILHYKNEIIIARAVYSRIMRTRLAQAYPWINPGQNYWQTLSSRIWEQASVMQDLTVHISALIWLTNSINLASQSVEDFKLILDGLNSLDDARFRQWPIHNHDAPWSRIFNLVMPPSEVFNRDNASETPSCRNDKIVQTIAQLLMKMSIHPDLFERTISGTSDTMIVALIDQLATHPPSSEKQAMDRLKCLTALFSSKKWERMGRRLQPVYPTFQILLDCLKVGDVSTDETCMTWLFTLCEVRIADAHHEVPWPDAEFIGVISFVCKHDRLRNRAIEYYIDYLDALLMNSELPLTQNRRWRWHNVLEEPKEGCQTAMLQILAEYLLQKVVSSDNPQDQQDITLLLEEWELKVRSPALRMILRVYQSRPQDALPSNLDMRWGNEAWLYAAIFSNRLRRNARRRRDEASLPGPATQIMVAVLTANRPVLNVMLNELITKNIKLMTADHWIAIMGVLSKRNNTKEVERYARWMIELPSPKWLVVLNHFFGESATNETCDVANVLLHTLCDYLPDKLAQKRWRATMERLFHSGGRMEGSRRLVDIVWTRSEHPESDDPPLVISPLPRLLNKIIGDLAGARRSEDVLRFGAYVRIADDLTHAYEVARSIDEDFLMRFRRIATELRRTRNLLQNPNDMDESASLHGRVSLDTLLDRIARLRDPPNLANNRQPPITIE